ncbi:MAG: hypothetical protein JWL64_1154 [Frankiales bacterium]|nr:hypothetical protein [Frankiales bacterium]
MSSPRAAFAAHLRVYEPLAAFAGGERRAWEAYAAAGAAPDRERGLQLEHEAALRAVAAVLPVGLPDLPDHAFVTQLEGVTLVCPWRTRVRAAEAFVEFSDGLHDDLVDAYLPRAAAESVLEELDDWRSRHQESRVHVLTSAWQVPSHWFLAVDPEERDVQLGAPGPGSGAPPGRRTGRALVYRTPMSRARRRLARSLAVLRRTMAGSGVVDTVEGLARWLEEFHPRSLVELDYGGLVDLRDDDALREDTSAADVHASLAAIGEDRTDEAAEAYGRVLARMKTLQAFETAN